MPREIQDQLTLSGERFCFLFKPNFDQILPCKGGSHELYINWDFPFVLFQRLQVVEEKVNSVNF